MSLCMIVRNEAANLQTCLDSVRELAPEIVIVDTGSTDESREIARRNGAKVYPFDFAHIDFAAARNYGIERASGRWILVLDADETIDPDSIPAVRSVLQGSGDSTGYCAVRRNQISALGSFAVDYVVRLFPNRPTYRYECRVHETVNRSILASGGALKRSTICIDHAFALDPKARQRKNLWYAEILLEEMRDNPSDRSRARFLAAGYRQIQMLGMKEAA